MKLFFCLFPRIHIHTFAAYHPHNACLTEEEEHEARVKKNKEKLKMPKNDGKAEISFYISEL